MTFAAMRAAPSNGRSFIRAGAQRAYSWRGAGAGAKGRNRGGASATAGTAAVRSNAGRRSRQARGALLAVTSATGATVLCASAAVDPNDNSNNPGDGRDDTTLRLPLPHSIETSVLRPLKQTSQDALLAMLRLLAEVARTDAAAPVTAPAVLLGEGEGGSVGVADLVEGEKPELIKQADAEAERKVERLGRPPQFADQFHEVRGLTSVHAFEGFRVDLTKVVTPTFYNSHTIMFPNSQMPAGLYQGALTVVGENDQFIRATMDHEMNVTSEMHIPLGMGVQGKVNVQLGKNDVVMGTASYAGKTFSSQVVAGAGGVFGISYNQALTPRLAVGGDGNFNAAQQAAQLQYGFKYNTPGWAFTGSLIGGGGGHVVLAQYIRRVVPGRVALGAEYQAALLNPEQSQTCVGAEFTLRQSKVSASVDSTGKVDSTLEMKLMTFLPMLPVTLTLSSSLDHGAEEPKSTFGLGLSLGQ